MPPGQTIDILAAGDSFTAGYGVPAADSWPKRLESVLNTSRLLRVPIRVLNAGVSGYSVTQIRLAVEEFLALEPRVVIVGVYPSRVWRLTNPYVFFEGQAVLRSSIPHLLPMNGGFLYSELDAPKMRQLHFWLIRHFQIGARIVSGVTRATALFARRPEEQASPWENEERILIEELGRLAALCRRRNARLVVLMVNHQDMDARFDTVAAHWSLLVKHHCAEAGIAVFDPTSILEERSHGRPVFRIGRDHHWSRQAHHLVAQKLAAYLLRDGPFLDAYSSELLMPHSPARGGESRAAGRR